MELGKNYKIIILTQQFLFDITDEKELVLTVMDKDLVNDDLVGEGRINLESLKKKGRITDEWYIIEYKKKPSGNVQLDIEYYPADFKDKSKKESRFQPLFVNINH